MSNIPRNLTRAQLAELTKDQRVIRVLEQLVTTANSTTPEAIAALQVDVAAAQADATAALTAVAAAQADATAALAAATAAQADATAALTAVAAAQADATAALAAIAALGSMSAQDSSSVSISGGTVTAQLKNNQTILLQSTVTLTNGAAAAAGTISNAPVAGNPTKWVAINDNGVTRYIPAW
jgi:hypothetical protein